MTTLAQTTALERKVIGDVPQVAYDRRSNPLLGSIESALLGMKQEADYDFLMTVSGAAFRRLYKFDDPANVAVCYINLEPARRAFEAAGYQLARVGPDRAATIAAIRSSIDAGRPVIGFDHLAGPPEPCVITGYDKGGEVLMGWSYFQPGRGRYHENGAWKTDAAFGVLTFGEAVARPTDLELAVDTVAYAIDLSRQSRRIARPEHTCGLAAYDAWAAALEHDALFPAGRKDVIEHLAGVQIDQVAMVYERGSAAKGLRQLAEMAPEAGILLNQAAELYDQVSKLAGRLPYQTVGADLRNPERRRALAEVVREARGLEEKAVVLLEQSLEILQPVPEKAMLTTPQPDQLTQKARWQVENIPLGIVFRAAMDVTGDDFGRKVTPDGWSTDYAYDLMHGSTGEGFRFGLNINSEGKHIGFRDYGAAFHAAAFRCALEALRYEGEVLTAAEWKSPEVLRAKVISAIARQARPVVLADVPSPGQYALIVGYENAGGTLVGYDCGGGGPPILFEADKRKTYTDWAAKATAAAIFKERIGYPDEAFVYRRAIERGVAILRASENDGWMAGPALFDAWAAAFAPEATLEACASKIDPYIWDLAERRHYSRQFLQRAAKTLPSSAEQLEAAAKEFGAIHDLMWKINQTATDKPRQTLGDPKRREAVAAIIRQAKAHDAKAAELLAQVLARP